MITLHFVIKRHANIGKYLEQTIFLENFASVGSNMLSVLPSPRLRNDGLCKVGVTNLSYCHFWHVAQIL